MENQEEKPEGEAKPTPTKDVRVQPKAATIVDNAITAAERLEKATEEAGKVAGRIEDAVAKNMLGGRTEAGQPKLSVEEEKKAEAQKVADEIVKAFN